MKNTSEDIIIIGTKEELEFYIREIDFDNMQERFNKLNEPFKNIVINQVKILSEGNEFWGYNLRQVQDWFACENVRKNRISKFIYDFAELIFDIETAEKWEAEGKNYTYIEKLLDGYGHRLHRPKERKDNEMSVIDKTIKILCQFYMISEELLIQGKGEIYQIADKYFDEIMNSEFLYENIEDNIGTNIGVKEIIEDYAKKHNIPTEQVLEVKYAVIKQSGSYLYLKEKNKALGSAIDNLIRELEVQSSLIQRYLV